MKFRKVVYLRLLHFCGGTILALTSRIEANQLHRIGSTDARSKPVAGPANFRYCHL